MTGGARGDGESGTVTVLTLGLMTVALGLTLTVADAGAVFVDRRALAGACDGAATAAAQAADEPALYRGDHRARLPLDLATARHRVARYVQQVGVEADVRVVGLDGSSTTVTVACTRRLGPPFAGWLRLAPRRIAVTATAASPVR